MDVLVAGAEIKTTSESPIGKSEDFTEFDVDFGEFSFRIDPVLIQRGFKVANELSVLPTLMLMRDGKYIHLISHST